MAPQGKAISLCSGPRAPIHSNAVQGIGPPPEARGHAIHRANSNKKIQKWLNFKGSDFPGAVNNMNVAVEQITQSIPSSGHQKRALSTLSRRSFSFSKHKKGLALYLCLLPLLALFSYQFLHFETTFTPEAPGGKALEFAFWLTSFAASFFAFFSMEHLFRSKDSKLLASQPIHETTIFSHKVRSFIYFILLSTPPMAALWFSYALHEPLRAAIHLGLWFFGLLACCVISFAIVFYGAANAKTGSMTNFGPAAYVAAPAIALAVSLLIILLLKLLGEAVLKPGFLDAALTAMGIVGVVVVAAYLYARSQCKKHYYRILAEFNENDLILLNENYAFLNDREALAFKSLGVVAALQFKDQLQYKRRGTLMQILIITLSVLMGLWLLSSPQNLYILSLPLLSILPMIMFGQPWSSLNGVLLEPGILNTLPMSARSVYKAKILATTKIALRMYLPSFLAVGIALLYHSALSEALLSMGLALLLCGSVVICFALLSIIHAGLSPIMTYIATGVILLLSLITQSVWVVWSLILFFALVFVVLFVRHVYGQALDTMQYKER